MDAVGQDFKQAFRSLSHSLGYSFATIFTVGLSVAATAVLATVLWAVVLAPLPYPGPGELAVLAQPDGGPVSGRVFHVVRDSSTLFDSIAAHGQPTGWNVRLGERTRYLRGFRVSHGFFATLGVAPLLGREFNPADDVPGANRVVIIGEAAWRSAFNADPGAIGRVIQLGGASFEVVGVMPASLTTFPSADVWTPLQLPSNNNSWSQRVIGRLKDGHTLAEAQHEYGALAARWPWSVGASDPNTEREFAWVPYRQLLTGHLWTPLVLLLGSAFCLLIIASTNAAALSVVRAGVRGRETAARMALGASRGRVLRMLTVESMMLGVAAAGVGVAAGWLAFEFALPLVPSQLLGGRIAAFDWPLILLTVALSVTVCVVCGLAPYGFNGATRAGQVLERDSGRHTVSRTMLLVRRGMVVGQLAVAVTLLITAALLVRTFGSLRSVDVGFSAERVVVAEISLQGVQIRTAAELLAAIDRTARRLRALPGVMDVAVGTGIPIERGLNLPLAPIPDSGMTAATPVDWRYVSPDFFAVFGVDLVAGRLPSEQDHAAGAPIATVSEAFARKYFAGRNPLGQRIGLVNGMSGEQGREVVGIVADVKGRSGATRLTGANAIVSDAPPIVYAPVAQMPDRMLPLHASSPLAWSVKTHGAAGTLARQMEEVMLSELPATSLMRATPMAAILSGELASDRFRLFLVGTFAGLSSIMAAIGLYGLLTYVASVRRKEIGIRIALGAEPSTVLRHFLGEAMVNAAAGVVLGVVGAMALSGVVGKVLWGVTPFDTQAYATSLVLFAVLTTIAGTVPAFRASRVDPAATLRE